jgi:aspartate racemase
MKTIGLIGGMSWESTKVYYEYINHKVNDLMGGFHSAEIILHSVDFAEIEKLQHEGNWEKLCSLMAESALRLENAGADVIALCTNTMHLCSSSITEAISVPFVHIAEATGTEISKNKIGKVALLGTKFTMEKDFFKTVLKEKFGIEVIVPYKTERERIHQIIYNELVHGEIRDESREKMKTIIANMQTHGAEGVILGCTEIPLLITDKNVKIDVFDTTKIHAKTLAE